ncbi:MAG: calcium-binding protein, partial [Alphaproteobacteria bacterium]|nr:calcium-binding protein [Alphaproteobacteria bacterium]
SSAIGQTVDTVSANGLEMTSETDFDGDLIADVKVETTTVLNADGSRTTTRSVDNRDGTTRSEVVTTISDDQLVTTVQSDRDGDGADERKSTGTTVLNNDGSSTETLETEAADGSLLNRSQTTISDDGLTLTQRADADADGTYDLTSETQTVLQNDGGTVTTTELRDSVNALRNSRTVTISDDARSIVTEDDVNADGQADLVTTRLIADDGTIEAITSAQNSDETLQRRLKEVTSDDGLTVTTSFDQDGDGTFESVVDDQTFLEADGSTTRTIERKDEDGSVYGRTQIDISDDGLTETVRDDWNGNGQHDRTTTRNTDLASDGTLTFTQQTQSENGTVIEEYTEVTSADGRTVTQDYDADGNGYFDAETTTILGSDGKTTSTTDYSDETGTLLSTIVSTTSSDGLESTWSIDRDGDGT